jgi:hypothetical protein
MSLAMAHATASRHGGCIISMAVGIAQLAEHRTVAPTVAGSIPVSHPRFFPLFTLLRLRRRCRGA